MIAFHDNSSAQRGFPMRTLLPRTPGRASPMIERACDYDFTLTAETHNFPTGICPFPGAETGPGGRIRDGQRCAQAMWDNIGMSANDVIFAYLIQPKVIKCKLCVRT